MINTWLFLVLLSMSCPVFAASNAAENATSVTAKTQKTAAANVDSDADATTAATTKLPATPGTTPTQSRTSNPRNQSLRWHSMLPGMFR